MDSVTFEEKAADESAMGDNDPWLFEGMECGLVEYDDKVIDVDLPNTCTYTGECQVEAAELHFGPVCCCRS